MMAQTKPQATTRENEIKALCDLTLGRAAELALEHGASFEMMLDRFMTFTLCQTVATYGPAAAIEMLEIAITQVESGKLDHLEGRGRVDIN